MRTTTAFAVPETHCAVNGIFGQDIPARELLSLINRAMGVRTGAAPPVNLIGKALASPRKLAREQWVTQVGRLSTNDRFRVWDLLFGCVPANRRLKLSHHAQAAGQAYVVPREVGAQRKGLSRTFPSRLTHLQLPRQR